jgi:hypothetical protein
MNDKGKLTVEMVKLMQKVEKLSQKDRVSRLYWRTMGGGKI